MVLGFTGWRRLTKSGRHLKNLFERRIVAAVDGWAAWDGKNEKGEDSPPGRYYVIFFKGWEFFKKRFFDQVSSEPVSGCLGAVKFKQVV